MTETTTISPTARRNRTGWILPAGLLLLSLVPILAGASRVAQLAGGAEVTSANQRFFDMPIPVVLHIFGASTFAILGAFQLTPGVRNRHLGWHRLAGRYLVVPAGLVTALTGLWMARFYPLPATDGSLLFVFRMIFGTAMLASIVLALVAVARHDIPHHGAWMIRAYAIGLGAGTQVFTNLPWVLVAGQPDQFTRALLMGAGWMINLVVAEWVIRTRVLPRSRRSRATRPTI